MRKADLKRNHYDFDNSVLRYKSFLEKIIAAQRVVSNVQEKRDVVESVLLRLCANWESFVDNHLVCCVNVDHSKLDEFLGVPIPAHPSKNLCTALIFGDGYRDFASFAQLKGFTKKILPELSNPFLQVSNVQAKRIDEVYKIRNYLSHFSSRSKRALHQMYKNQHGMTNFLEPGVFLLAYDASRLWTYFNAFQGASDRMKAWY